MVLPAIGLILFSAISYHSYRWNREAHGTTSKYFWWSAIRLDSDPANQRKQGVTPCENGEENCNSWNLRDTWVDPGLLENLLLLSALPAFVIGRLAVGVLGKLGISQVLSFMIAMPVLIVAWYYFIGWLLDRRKHVQ